MRAYIAQAPIGALLFVLASYTLGTFAGAWVAARLAGRCPILHGLIVGGVFLFFSVLNLMSIPHPLWFAVVALALFLPVAYVAAKVAAGLRTQASQVV